jgi:putative nucleotidyltransferase with HDIG domain
MVEIKRTRILYPIMLVLMLVSIVPLTIYGWQLITLIRERVQTDQRIQQTTMAKTLADCIDLFIRIHRSQMQSFANSLESTGSLNASFENVPELEGQLQRFMSASPSLLYISLVNTQGKGSRAGSFNADDEFVNHLLSQAFASVAGGRNQFHVSTPTQLNIGSEFRPAVIMSVPVIFRNKWMGAIISILALDEIQTWVQERKKDSKVITVYVVNEEGRIVVHPDAKNYMTGKDVRSEMEIVKDFVDDFKQNKGMLNRAFDLVQENVRTPMLGTYCHVREAPWGVIVQIEQSEAFVIITDVKRSAIMIGLIMLLLAVLVGSFGARSIVSPLQQLAESTRSIARGDFSKKINIRSRTEIGELSDTFNQMTEDLRRYVEQLQWAAKKNRDLFLGTIRALAAAIDEKDPYTRGHSERVTQFSMVIGKRLGLNESQLETLRVAALLHDVGKIGIDDSVLKKPGILNQQEFEFMRQHTVKGANIMKSIEELRDMVPGMKHHHEQWDGNGYPDRLQGENIPILARIISVADTLDAMTTDRPYQQAFDIEATLTKIRTNSGVKYDPWVVKALTAAFENGDFEFAFKSAAPAAV